MRIWVYSPEIGEEVTIGYEVEPRNPDVQAVQLAVSYTDDREEAEEWRQALANGKTPGGNPAANSRVNQRMMAELKQWELDQQRLAEERWSMAFRERRSPEGDAATQAGD
jgi:hypothetical protein